MKTRLLLPAAILAAATAGRLSAQDPAPESAASKLLTSEAALELKCAEHGVRDQDSDLGTAMTILADAPKDPAAVRSIAGQSLVRFYAGRAKARSAMQASEVASDQVFRLNLLEVQQNQRIIALLEQLAAKK